MSQPRTSRDWERVEPILDAVLDLPESERSAYLETACGGDEALRHRVERLLASVETPHPLLDGGASPFAEPMIAATEAAAAAAIPDQVGPYRIMSVLGEGGMGAVYLGERADDQYRKQVAIKLVRAGLEDDPVLRRRFVEERQILAALEHPGIARLLDGGVTSRGVPWFALEYVDGVPLDKYAIRQRLGTRARLDLFLQVCAAVQYAHQNLVIHRDLKPSNILVTTAGRVQLLDFGIAKLVDPASSPIATAQGGQPLTPEYASPEQLGGRPVSTATDVYSLGIVLYELLTGRRPHSSATLTPAEFQRRVETLDPPMPSRSNPGISELRGDLDRILLMALRKEPERRYASVEQLAEDIRRYLGNLPIRARPDSWSYRAGKFVTRHRWPVIVATTVAVGLIGFAAVTRRQAQQIRIAAERTAAERDKATAVTHTLWELLSRETDDQGKPLTVADVLARAPAAIQQQYASQPGIRARMQSALGMVRYFNGDPVLAESLLRVALASQRADSGDSVTLATELETLGWVMAKRQNFAAADSLLAEARLIHRRPGGEPSRLEPLETYAGVLIGQERYPAAEILLREVMAREAAGEVGSPGNSAAMVLADAFRRQRRFAEARPLLVAEVTRLAHPQAADSYPLATALLQLGMTEGGLGHRQAADSALDRAEDIEEQYTGVPPAYRITALAGLALSRGQLEVTLGDTLAAARMLDSARALYKRVLTPPDARWAAVDRIEGQLRLIEGRLPDAERLMHQSQSRLQAGEHPVQYQIHQVRSSLAELYLKWQRPESLAVYRQWLRPDASSPDSTRPTP
ncbi:MAG: serine/threonine-protein kinase [Gemmatimonadota bacterium]